MSSTREFDLNVEKVLEHWSVAHALREIIANALDEQALTNTSEPQIFKDSTGTWHIRDFGRGLRYEHLTQNENKEKLGKPHLVIGKFGVGLKDALATLYRRRVDVQILSRFGDITVGKRQKHGFSDIATLHAIISQPSDPNLQGTEFILRGVTDKDVAGAKDFFLVYSGERTLESTEFGQVLERRGAKGRVYVNGLHVADEDNFLFSYNITSLTAPLRKALNRERTNVGRSAYSDRVKAILLKCSGKDVAERLTMDLGGYETGGIHDELAWTDVALHACRIMNASEKVIFVTAYQIQNKSLFVQYAKNDGYRIVMIPESIAHKLPSVTDLAGQRMHDLDFFESEWNQSFEFKFVPLDRLTPNERRAYLLTWEVIGLLTPRRDEVSEVLISETMRVNPHTLGEAAGIWEPDKKRIVIKRDQLRDEVRYAGTLLHELTHAMSRTNDMSLEFEEALSFNLGNLACLALGKKNS